ncbi:MAG: hypothetical protein EZS28_008619 [Streblomastix strix]|uniref:Yippee domain-containing protein n=1 Tax=Streblomastix strix TaxID=222440 RepID=A0A5J4WM32_9EUKA|nr:MAG: hypothetical protein EZS28_008619 [Streblomastix strix]
MAEAHIGANGKNDSKEYTNGSICKKFWHLSNMMDFENIGFSKNVVEPSQTPATSTSASTQDQTVPMNTSVLPGHVRFLTCCACDQGPVGVALSDGGFFIEAERVQYG